MINAYFLKYSLSWQFINSAIYIRISSKSCGLIVHFVTSANNNEKEEIKSKTNKNNKRAVTTKLTEIKKKQK